MSDDENGLGAGTRFPFINLEKAIGRAKELFDADQRGREMAIQSAFAVWSYSEKSSGGFQTIAALRMYGLIRSAGGKIVLTESALRYFRDEREAERGKLVRQFALAPKLIGALWKDWRASPPADTVARSHLKAERGLTDQGARSLLAIYKENLAFADLKGDAKVTEEVSEESQVAEAAQPQDAGTQAKPLSWVQKIAAAGSAGKVEMMPSERVVFTEEGQPSQYLKLIASGELDDGLLEALEAFVERQRKRLKAQGPKPQ